MTGMKSGAGDDPFADEPDDTDTSPTGDAASGSDLGGDRADEPADRRELPYKFSRESVKEGRTQRPMFVQDETEAGIDELQDALEDLLDEDTMKTDVVEAALLAGIRDPEAVAEVMREWGYDY